MAELTGESLDLHHAAKAELRPDPRILRTRHLLQQSLGKLLESKNFDEISVNDIAAAATLNRATFYDHYPDKFALLECMVATRFHQLLESRQVRFDGTCAYALRAIILGVCDFLSTLPNACAARQQRIETRIEPHTESAIIAVVRGMILTGMQSRPNPDGPSPEIVSATLAWAIFGAAKEWLQTPVHPHADVAVDTIHRLISPIFAAPHPAKDPAEDPSHVSA